MLSQKQLKNKIDLPTVKESVKELAVMSILVGSIYFFTELQEIDFGMYSGIVVAVAKVAIKFLEEFKKGDIEL